MSLASPLSVSRECRAIADLLEDHGFCLLDQSPASPFRALDWRWRVAMSQVRTGSRARPRWIDEPVKQAVSYLRQDALTATAGRSNRSTIDHVTAEAVGLRSSPNCATRTAIEALLLGGLDDHRIAAIVGTDANIVAAYHDLFFDVRSILNYSDVVMARVFGERLYRRAPDRETAVRLLSFQGGPLVAEALVSAVVLPGDANSRAGHGELIESFEEYLIASSLATEGSSISTILGLNIQASQLALAREDRTVASVTKPLSIGDFDVRKVAEPVDFVRATDPIGHSAGSPVRAEGAPVVVVDGPDEVDDDVAEGVLEGVVKFGIAV